MARRLPFSRIEYLILRWTLLILMLIGVVGYIKDVLERDFGRPGPQHIETPTPKEPAGFPSSVPL